MQQVLCFYQHLARLTTVYVQQVPKAKILPTVCHIIHFVPTAAICEIPLRLQPPPTTTVHYLGKKMNFVVKAPKQSSISKGPKPSCLVDVCLPKTSRNKADHRTVYTSLMLVPGDAIGQHEDSSLYQPLPMVCFLMPADLLLSFYDPLKDLLVSLHVFRRSWHLIVGTITFP